MLWTETDCRIWRELRGHEDPFEGMGDQIVRTRSSITAPLFKVDPFNVTKNGNRSNEIAVMDDENPAPTEVRNSVHFLLPPPPTRLPEEEEDWSDVST